MTWGVVAAVVSAVSFVYNIAKAQEARRRQKKAQKEAEARADAALGFQFVVEGETKALPVPYGRNKIGGARVHHFLSNSYYLAPPAYERVPSAITLMTEVSGNGAASITGGVIRKTGIDNKWDTGVRATEAKEGLYVKFKLSQTSGVIRVGASAADSCDLTATLSAAVSQPWGEFISPLLKTVTVVDKAADVYALFNADGTAEIVSSVTKAGNDYNRTYTTDDIFEYSVVAGVAVLYHNGVKWFTGQFTGDLLFFVTQLYTSNSEIQILETGSAPTQGRVFRNRYRKSGVVGDCYLLMNEEDSYSGEWLNPITIPLAGSLTGHPQRILDMAAEIYPVDSDGSEAELIALENEEGNDYKGKRWHVPENGWVIVRNGDTFAKPVKSKGIFMGPKTDFIYTPFKKNLDGSWDTVTKPTFAIDFPAPTQGTEDKLANSKKGTKHEYFYIQQAMCHAGIHDIIAVDVDDKPHSSATLKEGLRIHAYRSGGIADPLMYLTDGSRTNAKFSGVAYLTGVFKLDRDQPQYSATPEVKCYIEGMEIRHIIKTGDEYTLSTDKVYSNNPALCLLDYLLSKEYGRGLDVSEVILESFYRAAVICDTIVQYNANLKGRFWKAKNIYTRDVPLYEANIIIDTGKPIRDNIEALLETMGLAELIWSDGKYKLMLNYPFVEGTGRTYVENDTIQFFLRGRTRILRCLTTTTVEPTESNTAEYEAEDLTGFLWADDVVAAYLTDDHLMFGGETALSTNWADAQTRLNFATVRFLNEAKMFAEDSVSWPKKSSSVPYEVTQLPGLITASSASDDITFTLPVSVAVDDVIIVGDKYLGKVATTVTNGTSVHLTGAAMFSVSNTSAAKGNGKNLYKHYLNDIDNNAPLEGDFFENGVTTYQHALAKAEQRVRTTRGLATYGYTVGAEFFRIEPNDFISISSKAAKIDDLLMTVNEVSPRKGGFIEISSSTFDARMLAWNALDSDQPEYVSPYFSPLGQASDIQITDLPNSPLATAAYRVSWQPANDNRVTKYAVRYTEEAIADITELDTQWMEIGITENNYIDMPLLTGTFTFVVISGGEASWAPYADMEYGSEWPMVEATVDSSAALSAAVGIVSSTRAQITGASVLKMQPGGYGLTVLSASMTDGVDELTGTYSYRWSDVTEGAPVILNNTVAEYNTKFGYRAVASSAAPDVAELGANVTNSVLFTPYRQLVLSQKQISSAGVIMCEIKDEATGSVYPTTMTVSDMSDPYFVTLETSSGTTLRNGLGSTSIWPLVYLGNDRITDLTGWTFEYYIANENGSPAGFPAPEKTAGLPVQINGNSAVVRNSFTMSLEVPITVANGDLIKVFVNADAWYFKCEMATNSVSLTCYSTADYPLTPISGVDVLYHHELYICKGTGADAGRIIVSGGTSQFDAAITVDGNDIDRKAKIGVVAYAPF